MEIKIIENKKQSLYVYKNDELLFYSTIKFNWTRKNLVKIFNSNDELIIEVQSYEPMFGSAKYKIIFQNKEEIKDCIIGITEDQIFFNDNKILNKQNSDFLSFNQNCLYFFNKIMIAKIEQKMWNSPQKIILNIDEKESNFLNVIIHVLIVRTGYDSK